MPVQTCRERNMDGVGTGAPGFRWNNGGECHYYDASSEEGRNAAYAAALADGQQDTYGHPDPTALYPAPAPNPYDGSGVPPVFDQPGATPWGNRG